MSKYQQFIFESFDFNKDDGELHLHYSLDSSMHFTESFRFDFPFVNYNDKVLMRAQELLFFLAGVSYYKTYLPPEIVIKTGQVDDNLASFLSSVYQKGLGEFFYVNKLDPKTKIVFPANTQMLRPLEINSPEGTLVGVGGGKDSLVSVELLRNEVSPITTWSLNHRPQLTPLVERIALKHAWVERQLDPKLSEINKQPDSYNGHIPISAIFAATGLVVAILSGNSQMVVSNEHSANEPTLHYQGVAINHQYSKSEEFEVLFQDLLQKLFGSSFQYFSFLRPLSDLSIAELFAKHAFAKYKDVFSSCNRAFVHNSNSMSWCGICPKCAFVFLVLTPFVDKSELEALWGGKNLLLDPELEPIYRQLLGIEGDKPLECVGEVKESRAAMLQAQKQYPELSKYKFDLPDRYDYRQLGSHHMPENLYAILVNALKT